MSNVSECVCVDGCVCVGGGVGRHIVAACVSHPRGPSLVPPRVHHVVGDQPLAAVYRTPSATSQVVIVHEGGDHPLLAYPSPDAIIRVTRIPLEGRAPGSPGPQLDFAQSFNRWVACPCRLPPRLGSIERCTQQACGRAGTHALVTLSTHSKTAHSTPAPTSTHCGAEAAC